MSRELLTSSLTLLISLVKVRTTWLFLVLRCTLGDVLAIIRTMDGREVKKVEAEFDGYIIAWRQGVAVYEGDTLGMVAVLVGVPGHVTYKTRMGNARRLYPGPAFPQIRKGNFDLFLAINQISVAIIKSIRVFCKHAQKPFLQSIFCQTPD